MRSKSTAYLCAAFLLFALSHSAAAMTLSEAQTLPKADIIKRTFGDLAAIIIDMERPNGLTYSMGGLGPPRPSAALRFIDFYTRARYAGPTGLCGAQILSVEYDAAGNTVGFRTTNTFGVVKSIKSPPPRRQWADETPELSLNCASAPSTRDFFTAPNADVAARAALAMKRIADDYLADTAPTYPRTCKFFSPNPSCGPIEVHDRILGDIGRAKINGVNLTTCDDEFRTSDQTISGRACLDLTLNDTPSSAQDLLLDTDLKDGNIAINAMKYVSGFMKIH